MGSSPIARAYENTHTTYGCFQSGKGTFELVYSFLMNESYEKVPQVAFVQPNIEAEKGEIERVASVFATDNPEAFVSDFLERAQSATLEPLAEGDWQKLENTDSFDISVGDWSAIEYHAVGRNPDAPRDWEALRVRAQNGEALDAPIVAEVDGILYLVSGNTRLMVSRAMGVTPMVLIVKMGEIQDSSSES